MSNLLQQYKPWTKDLSDEELIRMLRNVFFNQYGHEIVGAFILADGSSLRGEHVRSACVLVEEKGWVEFHHVEENDQSAYFRGEITEEGKRKISDG